MLYTRWLHLCERLNVCFKRLIVTYFRTDRWIDRISPTAMMLEIWAMSDDDNSPVPVTVLGDKGYVWEAKGMVWVDAQSINARANPVQVLAGVKWLRQQCRIVGAMTGSSAGALDTLYECSRQGISQSA